MLTLSSDLNLILNQLFTSDSTFKLFIISNQFEQINNRLLNVYEEPAPDNKQNSYLIIKFNPQNILLEDVKRTRKFTYHAVYAVILK